MDPIAPPVAPPAPPVAPVTSPAVEPKLIQVPEAEWKRVTEQLAQLPGMVKRMVHESVPPAPSKVDEPPKITPKEEAWTTEINKLKGDLEKEKAENKVREALAKKTWFALDENLSELLPKVKVKDGKYVVPGTKKIGDSEYPEDLTLDEAVEQLAKSKPWRVMTVIPNGSGAQGAAASGAPSVAPTYAQLMADPKLLAKWGTENPEYVRKVQDEAFAKQKGN